MNKSEVIVEVERPKRRRHRQYSQKKSQPRPQPTEAELAERERKKAERERERNELIARTPYIAVSIQTTGIHPKTAHIVSIDALVLDSSGHIAEEFHAVVNPGGDPGPRHLHGLTAADIAGNRPFSGVLKTLDKLIDGRTLIVHNAPYVWGFLYEEARRAMAHAARRNRSRTSKRGKRRQRVGHIPRPIAIADTLAGARRKALVIPDPRLRAVAHIAGIASSPAAASTERAHLNEMTTSRELTHLVVKLYHAGYFILRDPAHLCADEFGLQRSTIRVDAAEQPAEIENPGVYTPHRGLQAGMEFSVAPETTIDPDLIIETGLGLGMKYSEKITRTASFLVCNLREGFNGKSMHATRKAIPLLGDEEFMHLAHDVHRAQNGD
ncbi:exonuclease domain-containing protein [Corynebacterium sp. ES2775-CONJ]|nr:exonuclease domain-containing protein [Corynebacterium sp. ES2775-CONJ]MCS4490348.1 exonuclease domain-containing protein [Corynebacterium sp. ES2775-CONJ]